MTNTLYHNPRCSKSRETLKLLQEQGFEPRIVEYLKEPPDFETLSSILDKLGMEPRELMRSNETEYKALGLDDEALERDALIRAMVDHPILIERPILVTDHKAAIGRPPTRVLEVL